MNPPVYFISGLGLNERIFSVLRIQHPNPRYIRWIEPKKEELLVDYCQRLLAQIEPSDSPPILVGLSFGGIVALEIAKLIPVQQIVLISSIKHTDEKPGIFNFLRYVPVHKVTRRSMMEGTVKFWAPFFGVRMRKHQQAFLELLSGCSDHYMSWAVERIVRWENTEVPANLIHLHGTQDRIFPHSLIQYPETIRGGDHGMVVSHADHISDRLNKIICETQSVDRTFTV